MMEAILFLNTYRNYHTNGTNRSYWAKYFKILSEELRETNKMKLHSSFNEDMPIYEFYSESRGRYVRIMQYDPFDEVVAEEKYSASRFYTAWIDKRQLKGSEQTAPELVVCLLMTKSNVNRAERLIRSWFFESDERTKKQIDKIYEEQERMDEERNNK